MLAQKDRERGGVSIIIEPKLRLLRMRSSLLVAHVLSQGKDEDKGSLQKPKGLRQGEFP